MTQKTNVGLVPALLLCTATVALVAYFMLKVPPGSLPSDYTMHASAAADDATGKPETWLRRGERAVRERLKDGESARFRNVYFSRGRDNLPMACGEVNSRSGFGGYSGFQRFLSAGSVELTYFEQESPDFEATWRRFCHPP